MKRLYIIAAICILLGAATMPLFADKEEDETPPWMENIDLKGRSTYLVPKGAKREVIGSQIVVEPPNEYVARRLYEMEKFLEKELNEVKAAQADIKTEIEAIKASLDSLETAVHSAAIAEEIPAE